jgi:hypothetical protein
MSVIPPEIFHKTRIQASSPAAVAADIDAAKQKLCFQEQPTSDYTTTKTGGKIMAQCFSPPETGDNVSLANTTLNTPIKVPLSKEEEICFDPSRLKKSKWPCLFLPYIHR